MPINCSTAGNCYGLPVAALVVPFGFAGILSSPPKSGSCDGLTAAALVVPFGLASMVSSLLRRGNCDGLPAAALAVFFNPLIDFSAGLWHMASSSFSVLGLSHVMVPSTTGSLHLMSWRKIPKPKYPRWISQRSNNSVWWTGTALNVHHVILFCR